MGHTPAPWHVGEDEFHWWVSGSDTTKNVICEIMPRQIHYYDYAARQEEIPEYQDEDRANAALIAAAPELLGACSAAREALLSYMNGNDSPDLASELVPFLRAAIAKAEGKVTA